MVLEKLRLSQLKFFSNKINVSVLEKLIKIMKISNAVSSKKDGILKDKTFMFTGKLKK